ARGIVPGTVIGAEAISVRAAYEARSRHELEYFAQVASFPGFARATASTLSELSAAGVTPSSLEQLGESGPDNAALLRGFEQQMREASVADRTRLLQSALEEVQDGAELAKHPLLFLDVPIHSSIEKKFVGALAAASKEVLITCPPGDLRTIDNLRSLCATESGPIPSPDDSSLARLGFYLFSEAVPPEGKADDDVVFFSAPGEERECVEIVRRVLSEAKTGIRFDQIAILLRAPENYTSLMEAALRRAGIPAYFARGSRRPDPSGRALLALLACAAEGLSARRFAEYLAFAQVPPLAKDGSPPPRMMPTAIADDDIVAALVPTSEPSGESANEVLEPEDSEGAQVAGALRTPWKWEEL